MFAVAVISLVCSIGTVEAADVWIYGIYSSELGGGADYYIMDETIVVGPKGSPEQYCADLKTVIGDECYEIQTWIFGHDEGYIWAHKPGQRAFAIYAEERNAGTAVVEDYHPDLLAMYRWLSANEIHYR